MRIVGVDEAGRGPVLGPLVVGILSIPEADEAMLVEQDISDSKHHSAKKRGTNTSGFFNKQKNVIGTLTPSFVHQTKSIMPCMGRV